MKKKEQEEASQEKLKIVKRCLSFSKYKYM